MLNDKRYICEICGTVYESSHDCNKCKKSHRNPVGVVAIGYYRAADKYPSTIYIRMDDGENVKYERGKKC